MELKTAEVKSKSAIIGETEYPVYDTTQEAVDHQGEDAILELINTQAKTGSMNTFRTAMTMGDNVTRKVKYDFFDNAEFELLKSYRQAMSDSGAETAEAIIRDWFKSRSAPAAE